jgi:hypothetical protein
MTTLDYAHVFETQIRPRRRLRRLLLGLAAVALSAIPFAYVVLQAATSP